MKIIFKLVLFVSFFYCVQADELTDKLTALKNHGLVPLKTKLGDLKKVLRKLKNRLEHPAGKTVEALTESLIGKRFEGKLFDKKELEKYAEGYVEAGGVKGGYGYKTANLRELKIVAQAFKAIKVPNFVGISSDNVKKFLKNRGYNVETAWQDFIAQFDQGKRDKFYQDKNFSPKFLQGLKVIEDKIKEIFENAAQTAANNNEVFDFDAEFNEVGVNQTIEKIKQKKSSLIVRSTGKEDTDTLANAGGNESVPNVAPIASDILRAMGVGEPGKTGVVSSYFSEKSFTQRLDGGDPTLFDLPFTPVLIQRMIGELVHGLRSDNVKAFLKSKGITNISSQQTIKNTITTATSAAGFEFNKTFKAEEAAIDEMLEQAVKEGWQLRVMSPDGYDKNDAVAPNKNALGQAIATVVGGQIQRAGNFDQAYCAVVIEPVQAGKMIERRLTACGVMFTEEAEGSISKKDLLSPGWDFSKQARSTGITLIQASYGHNEGVVNSLVGVDSYFVTGVDSIYSVIRPKPFRKFPSLKQGIKLEDRDNPQATIDTPALTVYEVAVLKNLAVALEHYYHKPMDVEYVIDRAENVVYLVQARPLVHNKEKVEPSYFQDLASIKHPKYKGSVIGAAGGAVRVITSPDHVIAKSTMGEALDAYLKHKNKDKIQCIIVGEHAPATSHEATQFRTAVKPVIFVPQFNAIEEALEQRAQLVVDVQQETVIVWEGPSVSMKQLQQANLIAQGWRNYPISPQLSLVEQEPVDATIHAEYENFWKSEIKKGLDNATLNQLQVQIEKGEMQGCLDMMRDDDETKARAGLVMLLAIANKDIEKSLTAGLGVESDRHMLLLKKYILSVARNIAGSLHEEKDSDGYMKRLYYLRFLEALVYQQPSPQEVLQAGSLAQSIFKTAKLEKSVISELKTILGAADIETLVKKSDQEIEQLKKSNNVQELKKIELAKIQVQLAKAKEVALTPGTGQKWLQLIGKFRTLGLSEQEQKDFVAMFYTLIKFDMLPVWLHTSFETKFNQANLTNTVQQLIQEYQNSKAIFDDLQQKAQKIAQLKPDLFAEPKTYAIQRALLQEIVTDFTQQSFRDSFKNAQQLGKMAILFILEPFVDIFDKSIKATKSQKDVAKFKEMLVTYFELLQSVCSLEYQFVGFGASKNAANEMPQSPSYKLNTVHQRLNTANIKDDAQMNNSPNFDVNIPVIGSNADFESPQTLEDIFTFIHQSLINVNSWLMQKIGLDSFANQASSILPKLVKDILVELYSIQNKGWGASGKKVSLMGVSFKGNTLSLKFNYPLRSHSSMIMLDYVQGKKPFARLSCTTAGENEWGRFYKIGEYAKTVADILKLESEIKPAKKAVTFSWVITEQKFNEIKAEYSGQNIIGRALEWANDGDNGSNGLSYATDEMNNVKEYENNAFNFICNTLCKNNTDQKHQFAELVVNQSLKQNRVHMYIHRVLGLIKNDASGNAVWQKVFQVMDKLLIKKSLYAVNSDLSFFRFYRSPAFGDMGGSLRNKYYAITVENLYNYLLNGDPENNPTGNQIKDDSETSKKVLKALGVDSFRQAFARRMFNEIADKFDALTSTTKNNFAQLMKKHSDFFAELRELVSGFGGYNAAPNYQANTQLQQLLNKPFFNNDPGKAAKNLVAWYAQQKNTLNKGGLVAVGVDVKSIINANLEYFLELPNAAQLFLNEYSGKNITINLATELQKTVAINDDIIQKNALAILAKKSPLRRNQALKKALDTHKFSWIKQDVIGGMAFPDYATIQALKERNVGLIVTLTKEAQLPVNWFGLNIQNVYIPIEDYGVPTISQVNQALTRIKQTTDAGKGAVIHCAGGLGRTGILLACWLVKNENKTAQQAIDQVRAARPGSIETSDQEAFISKFETYLKTPQLDASIKDNIQNFAFGAVENQAIKNAVQEIKAKKALAQADDDLKQKLKTIFQQGYYHNHQLNPNILELYTLVSDGTITDQQVINAAKNSIVAALSNSNVADTLSPSNPVQREKLATIAAELIKKNVILVNEVMQIFQVGGYRRRRLLAGYVLLKSGYKIQPFLEQIKTLANESDSQGYNYQSLAQACMAAI